MNTELEQVKPGMALAAETLQTAAADLLAQFRRPSFRAGFGAAVLSAAVFGRMGARPSLAMFSAVMIGASVERVYQMIEDVSETSAAQRRYLAGLEAEMGTDAPRKI